MFTKYTSSTYPSLAVQYIIFTTIQPNSSFPFFDSGTTKILHSLSIASKFGKQYVRLHYTEMDSLCRWVLEMREKFNLMGKKAFEEFNPKPGFSLLHSFHHRL